MNIPIYRAKKIDSDEYVLGQPTYIPHDRDRIIMHVKLHEARLDVRTFEIDPSTLSISFPDMLDSEGTRIFASLSEGGKGGDKLEVLDCENANYVAKYIQYQFIVYNINPQNEEWEYDTFDNCDIKVIGIQE